MKKITLYSPGLATYNIGDKIIADSAKKQLKEVLDGNFIVELPTHTPHNIRYIRHLKDSCYKFVLGSNLLKSTLFGFKRQWHIAIWKSYFTGPCILVGAGWWQYNNKPNLYTKILLKLVLSKNHIHSVRDEYTKKMLESIGIKNVVNTSCPTMWSLTEAHCESIPKEKAPSVIFTITDYNKSPKLDTFLIKTLIDSYENVYFWPQGIGDYEYFRTLNVDFNKISMIAPTLEAFDSILDKRGVDFVGTRLHGGIRALQKSCRTLIISIDNRAKEKSQSFNLPIIEREEISGLKRVIDGEIVTKIKIPEREIESWKKQFT